MEFDQWDNTAPTQVRFAAHRVKTNAEVATWRRSRAMRALLLDTKVIEFAPIDEAGGVRRQKKLARLKPELKAAALYQAEGKGPFIVDTAINQQANEKPISLRQVPKKSENVRRKSAESTH